MQAKIRKDGDITVVELSGNLDFETTEPFRETCQDILSNSKVVFNLQELSFVGSSGINGFVDALKELVDTSPVAPRFCNVRSEFQRVFKAKDEQGFQIFNNETDALGSFVPQTIIEDE